MDKEYIHLKLGSEKLLMKISAQKASIGYVGRVTCYNSSGKKMWHDNVSGFGKDRLTISDALEDARVLLSQHVDMWNDLIIQE